jgi:hypothetical protein
MKSNSRQLSHRGKRSRKSRFTSLSIVAALSLSGLVLAGASSMQSAHPGNIPAARPRLAGGTSGGAQVARAAGSDQAFHPGMLPVVAGAWTADGPAPIQSGQTVAAPNNSVVGAVKTIAAHPSSASTIYLGAVNGSIWMSADGGTTWTPQTDDNNSLSVGAIKFDPTDGNHTTLIAGLGRFSSLSTAGTLPTALGGPRSGVLLTTDGATWTAPAGGGTGSILDGANITGVAARGKVLLASSDRGMYRSTDTGATFTLISNGVASGLPAGNYFDIAETPSAKVIPDGVVMVSDGSGGVEEWGNNGTFITTISTGSIQDAGSIFDPAGNFYVSLFGGEGVSMFDPTGMLIGGVGAAPGYNLPESIEQDNIGNFFVGNAGVGYVDPTDPTMTFTSQCMQPTDNMDPTTYPPCPVYKFDKTFTLSNTFYPDTEAAPAGNPTASGRGTDWGALVPF